MEIVKEIICKTKKEEKKVLAKLEVLGYLWKGTYTKPTTESFFDEHKHYKLYALQVWSDKTITFGEAEKKPRNKIITAKEFLKQNCIVIYQNDLETIALNIATGERAVAKCNPIDVYDFNTGAKLAFERLTEPKEQPVEQYYNGKVVCVKAYTDLFTVGKIYEIQDGAIRSNRGRLKICIKKFDDLQLKSEFIEIVE